MPQSVLTRKRSTIARIAILAMVFSLMAVALPASAHSVALDSTGPCPAATPSAGFTDIGGLDATTQTAINCLFAFGITTGTSATTYSPNDTITRWQMALFLVRQAADHGLTIPTATGQGYTDIGGFDTATQNAINQITQMGISKGTSSTTFSPNDGVTRWQMALFIYRLGLAAGVTFNNNVGHNEFTDIATLSAEAMTAINALADTPADPSGHIALGTGLSQFSPNLVLVRWQMALFLTRLLAADGVVAPAGIRVTVTPTTAATQAATTARAYTATFRNTDGTPYTGAVGITLRSVVSSVVQYDNDPVPNAVIESVSSFSGTPTVGGTTVTGFPGTDGVVNFVIRHAGAAQTVVPVAWEDLDGDGTPEISGNSAPTEPFGLGGTTAFTGVVTEAASGSIAGLTVTAVDKAANRFEVGANSYFYDIDDLLLVSGVGGVGQAFLDAFEAALNVGDVVTGLYDADAADQSTIDISTDNDPQVTIVAPVAAGVTTTGSSYTITGTAVPGYVVSIYIDSNNDGDRDSGEPEVAEVTAAADGTWSATVPLVAGANEFAATQRALAGDDDLGTGISVPTITQGTTTGASFTTTSAVNGGGAAGVLDPGDVITVDFSEAISGFGAGDTFTIQDPDLSTATLTCGASGNVTCTIAGDVVTITVVNVVVTSGGTAGISGSFTITGVSGFTTTSNGAAISLTGDRTAVGF